MINLARLIASGGQPHPRAHRTRVLEVRRILHGSGKSSGCDVADTRHRHEKTAALVLASHRVVSDAHEGIKAAVSKVLCATWQRCRVHFMRNVLAHAGKSGRRVASAFIATAFAQETPEAASRAVADRIRPKVPKLAAIMDEAETDVLAYMTFPGSIASNSTAPTRSNGAMARSSAAPRSWASSPTTTPSSAWSAPSCSSRMMSGPPRDRDT